MKKIPIHTIPVAVSFIWLILIHKTLNPISLKGPDFLIFYLVLVLGFYTSVFIPFSRTVISGTTYVFMVSVFLLGMVKIIKGLSLGKPVGFLMMVLCFELIVLLIVKVMNANDNIK